MKKKIKGWMIGGIVGFIIGLIPILLFFLNPKLIFNLFSPIYFILNSLLGSRVYSKIIGSEGRELMTIWMIFIIILMITGSILGNIKKRNEK